MPKDIWISANEAASILSVNSGRQIIPQYVRDLAQKSKIAQKKMDGRTNLYLRSDVEKIKVRPHGKNKPDAPTQIELPIIENVTVPLVEEKPIPAIPTTEDSQICNVERFEDMPPGSLKRRDFAEKNGIHNPDLGKWLELGVRGDRLPVTYYKFNRDKAAAFTPAQQEEVLAILRKHGKLK